MKDIRIALIGVDHWYAAMPLAQGVVSRDGVRLVGIWDRDPLRAAEVAAKFSVDRVDREWHTLVDDPDIDAVMSFVSVEENHRVCVAAAMSGKHVMSNKPVARCLDDATQVVRAVRDSGVHFLPAESRQRLGPRARFLRQWLEEGRLGTLESASMAIWAGLPQQWPGDAAPGWFADAERTAGGAWIDHAIYQIDLLRWVSGEEFTSIAGRVANLRYPDLAVEDFGVATATLSRGAVVTLENTWTAPPGAGFQSSGSVVGSEGVLRMDGILERNRIFGAGDRLPGWVEVALAPNHDQAADVDHWAAVIRGEVEPVATVEDAWHNLAACTAFYESVASGRAVAPATPAFA
jgi:predicted dehydrogenase